jgi:hypothetical protein
MPCNTTLSEDLEAKWAEKPAVKTFKDTKDNVVHASDFDLNNTGCLNIDLNSLSLVHNKMLLELSNLPECQNRIRASYD